MRMIKKYSVKVDTSSEASIRFEIKTPKKFTPYCVKLIGSDLWIWANINPQTPCTSQLFSVCFDDKLLYANEIKHDHYLGTFLIDELTKRALHVFYIGENNL
jgi:hypothetical protein